jgi:hypothetical protein
MAAATATATLVLIAIFLFMGKQLGARRGLAPEKRCLMV